MSKKILVVGLGSIGRRHVRNIKAACEDCLIAVLRQHSKDSNLGDIAGMVSDVFFSEEDALCWRPDAVIISNPAPFHIKTAEVFARHNCHLFIEKPLSVSMEGVDELLFECNNRRLIVMIGYVLRFLAPLRLVKEVLDKGRIGRPLSIYVSVGRFLPKWRSGTDYRKNVSARRDLGGGPVFELSHELDYARWLIGEVDRVSAVIDKVSKLEIDVEDIAEITLRFRNNAIGHVHMDMLDRAGNRGCRIVGEEGTLIWNWQNGRHSVELFSPKSDNWEQLWTVDSIDYNTMFIEQFRHFFNCINNCAEPIVNGNEGRRVLEIILAVKRSAKEGKVIEL